MQVFWIFAVVWAAMIAHSFWESSVEGRNAWDKNKYGWKIRFAKNVSWKPRFFSSQYLSNDSFLSILS